MRIDSITGMSLNKKTYNKVHTKPIKQTEKQQEMNYDCITATAMPFIVPFKASKQPVINKNVLITNVLLKNMVIRDNFLNNWIVMPKNYLRSGKLGKNLLKIAAKNYLLI